MKFQAVILLSMVTFASCDWACLFIGGSCKDYTENYCMGGYVTGKCSGGVNRRCCKPCLSTCMSNEEKYKLKDGACTRDGGKCQHNSNYCGVPYKTGKCGGPSPRRCCADPTTCYTGVASIPTTGASKKTAEQDKLPYYGVQASRTMAARDASAMAKYKSKILVAAKKYCVEAAVIAGIISRETRAGRVLKSNGFGFDNSGFGLMQVDKGSHTLEGTAFSQTHINQGTNILVGSIKGVRNKHPSWPKDMVYKGGISAYNVGVKNIQTIAGMDIGTTGDDYGNDVVARAQWFRQNGY